MRRPLHAGDHPCMEMAHKWFPKFSKFLESNVIIVFHKQYTFGSVVDRDINSIRISHSADKRIVVH